MPKSLWMGLALLIIAGCIAGLIYRNRHVKRTTDIAKLKQDIDEHLPVGTSLKEVEAYLNQRGFPHSYTGDSSREPEFRRTEAAMIRAASKSWMVRGDIQIIFKFDHDDRLTGYTVREIFTGP